MKRNVLKEIRKSVLLLALMLVIPMLSLSEGEVLPRKLTIMVYMCGSNLESKYGSATMDLMEMRGAKAGSEEIPLLVMVGGTDVWNMGYDPEKTSILEFKNGVPEIVHSTEKQDMGDKATLKYFLQYGKENYPAEDYALILWDHGGGALEGVCWDEQFSSSRLTLNELREAVEEANLGKKLSWIGFDACMMGSLEVAVGLSSVADYMIASQETEPSYGWNYSFLKNIEEDQNAAETGKRIVDAYFTGKENSRDVLTLACIDLSKVDAAADTVGDFFAEIEKQISTEKYPELANVRGMVRGAGGGLRGIENDNGYDLVDAEDLISQIQGADDRKDAALDALHAAVVYHRANIDRFNGLTLYHPWENKDKYVAEWRNRYRSMRLIDGYTKYVQSFGTLLTDEELIRWKNLLTRPDGANENGKQRFSVQLTGEEATHLSSAQMLIVLEKNSATSRLGEGVTVVGVVPAALSGDDIIRADYDERAIYVETEDGRLIGPMSYVQTTDGAYNVIMANLIPKDEYGFDQADRVLFYLDAADESPSPEIAHIRIWDEETQSYSTRALFDIDRYRMVNFWDYNKSYPVPEDGVLPDYYTWESGNVISHYSLPLPNDWHFVIRGEQMTDRQLYAMFRITDVQQNVYCSVPAPIENANRSYFQIVPEQENIPDLEIVLSGYLDLSDRQSMHLGIEVRNTGNHDIVFCAEDFLINDHRELNIGTGRTEIPADSQFVREWEIPGEQMALLEEFSTISFKAEWGVKEYSDKARLSFVPEEGCLDRIHVPVSNGHAEADDIALDMLTIASNDGAGLQLNILIRNDRDEAVRVTDICLNGYELNANSVETIDPKRSRVVACEWKDGLYLSNTELDLPGEEMLMYDVVPINHWLSMHGQKEISSFGVLLFEEKDWENKNPIQVSGALAEPWLVKEETAAAGSGLIFSRIYYPAEASENVPLVMMAENHRIKIQFRRAVLGARFFTLILEASNETDAVLQLGLNDFRVNGEKVSMTLGSDLSTWMDLTCAIAPGCTRLVYISADVYDLLQKDGEIDSAALSFFEKGEEASEPVTISFEKSVQEKHQTELTWFSSTEVEIDGAEMKYHDSTAEDREGAAEIISGSISLPQNLKEYLQWIKAPLTQEELAKAQKGEMLLVIPVEEDSYVIVGYEKLWFNENGELGTLFPGLILCTSIDEQDPIPVLYHGTGDDGFEMDSLIMSMRISNDDFMDFKIMNVDSMKMRIDYATGEGAILDIQFSGDQLNEQKDMKIIEWYTVCECFSKREEGDYVSFQDAEIQESQVVGWGQNVQEGPLKLKMRPLQAGDGILLMFSVYNEDGTSYSRLISYEDAL